MVAVTGFIVSLSIHVLALSGRVPASELWFVVPFFGALVLFVLVARLVGAKAGRRGVATGEIVKACPTWLKRTVHFFSVYLAIVILWLLGRSLGIFHWEKVQLDVRNATVVFSAFAAEFYLASVAMLFGKLFGEKHQLAASVSNS